MQYHVNALHQDNIQVREDVLNSITLKAGTTYRP